MPGLSHPGVAFLDRDGTINEKAPEGEYITHRGELRLLPGAADAIRRLNDAGVRAIVITNQRGIALGRMTEDDLADVHAELAAQLRGAADARIDAFFHCPHNAGTCECRKPATGMFAQALKRFPWIELTRSAMVGDSASDVEAGRRLAMRTFRIGLDVPDLASAVAQLLRAESVRA